MLSRACTDSITLVMILVSNKVKSTLNVCEQYRIDQDVETLKHPAQSPDLNCQEGVRNIFMAKVRRHPRPIGTKRELMDICLEI